MSAKPHSYSLCILAGGKGSRFGGQDKGLILYRGKPLIEHLIDEFCSHTDEVIISANRNISRYEQYNYSIISDSIKNYAGPLAGALAACTISQNKWVFVVACDQPGVNHDIAIEMLTLADSANTKLVISNDGFRNQPLPMLLHTSLHNSIDCFLKEGDRKVGLWQSQQDASVIKLDQIRNYKNINAPEDL